MAIILNLETATTNCSVSISNGNETICLKEDNAANYSHSEQLHLFIKEALQEASLSFLDLDAVAISKGPGSYTGLRIGVSSAKGLCFSLDLPLISIPTLESMAHQIKLGKGEQVIPVLDARRMEVYSCVFGADYEEIRETRAEVITEASFVDFVSDKKVFVIGSGAGKCKDIIKHPNFHFDKTIVPSAGQMGPLVYKKFKAGQFEDVAYFEPYYLKDFVLQGRKKI